MNHPVVLTPVAEQDVARAQDGYEARAPGLGNRFVKQVRDTLTRISRNPSSIKSFPSHSVAVVRRSDSFHGRSGIRSFLMRAL